MAESTVQVTEGVGKKLHTWNRTIGANSVEDEGVFPAEYPYSSYVVTPAASVSAATAGDDIVQIMAGSTLPVRIRRIRLEQSGLATAAGLALFNVARVTTAGTAGTAITPSKMSNADSASGATAASGVPTATHGAIGALLLSRGIIAMQTAAAAGGATIYWEWTQHPSMEPIIIPAGITNGIVIRNLIAKAALTVFFEVEFVETNFV